MEYMVGLLNGGLCREHLVLLYPGGDAQHGRQEEVTVHSRCYSAQKLFHSTSPLR